MKKESSSHSGDRFSDLDRTCYARWLPVHICDMECLEREIPPIAAKVKNVNLSINFE